MLDLKLNMFLAQTRYDKGFPTTLYQILGLNPDEAPSILEELSDYSFNKYKIPCAGYINNENYYLAFASIEKMPRMLILGYDIKYKAKKCQENYCLTTSDENNRRSIGNIINRALRNYLSKQMKDNIWCRSKRARVYCNKLPELTCERNYDIFRCFKFRTDILPDGRIGFTIDPSTTILDHRNLFELYKTLEPEEFNMLFFDDKTESRGKYMIMDNIGGTRNVAFVEKIMADHSISDEIITTHFGSKISPYHQYKGVNPFTGKKLDPTEPAVPYKIFPKAREIFFAPSSCFYPVYSNFEIDSQEIKNQIIMNTDHRIKLTISFVNMFSKLAIGKGEVSQYNIKFSNRFSEPKDFKSERILLPKLKFGIGELSDSELIDIDKWQYVKQNNLKKYGPHKSANIGKLLIIHPEMPENILNDFYQDLRECASYWNEKLPDKYTSMRTKDYLDILDNLKKYQSNFDAALIVFTKYDEEIYPRIKSALSIPSQGVTLRTIQSKDYFQRKNKLHRYRNNLLNIISGLIGKAGAIPWILSQPLSSDCFIGIDSGGSFTRIWSYAYVFDSYGEFAGAEKGQAFKKEGLVKERFKNSIIQALGKRDHIPQRLVIHRDGKLVATEKNGLKEAIDILIADGKLYADVAVATVNIKKANPFRIYERTAGSLGDCYIGSCFYFDKNRALLVTTGKPIITQGTSNPLLLELNAVRGEFDIKDISKDIFYLSELNWGSPGQDIKLPITVRFVEQMIEYADMNIDFSGVYPI